MDCVDAGRARSQQSKVMIERNSEAVAGFGGDYVGFSDANTEMEQKVQKQKGS